MTNKKKIFAAASIVFFVLLIYASYDISRRTTFPGSKSQLKERINEEYLRDEKQKTDSAELLPDTIK